MPLLSLWYSQKYCTSPAVDGAVKVTVALAPLARSLFTPADAMLKLCSTVPWFLRETVTFDPAFTLNDVGLNRKSNVSTEGLALLLLLFELQAPRPTTSSKTATNTRNLDMPCIRATTPPGLTASQKFLSRAVDPEGCRSCSGRGRNEPAR